METTKFKPFDLEAAKAGAPVVTRGGADARIICYDLEYINGKCIVALVKESKEEVVITAYKDGCTGTLSDYDLFMKPQKKQVWKNFYIAHGSIICGAPEYNSQEEAENYIEHNKADSTWKYLCTQIIEWEE